MKHIFITYGDDGFETAKAKIVAEAEATQEFQSIYSLGREDLSPELKQSQIIKIKRGGGLWSWKPDVIYSTMLKHEQGDAIVYCDAGCSLYPSKEWSQIWKKLENHDMIAQKIFQKTSQWTRKEIIDYFSTTPKQWLSLCQFQATIIIIIISDFTLQFVKEWRDLMISNPLMAMDVTDTERSMQLPGFIENRHDQAVYSALVYKYLALSEYHDKIYTKWEHIEDLDLFHKQAIRATRLRQGQNESGRQKILKVLKRLVKDYIYKPFYYIPREWWNKK